MKQSLDDIADLAEDLGRRYLTNKGVNINKIAKNSGIELIRGNYNNHFVGELVHLANEFYIILNDDNLNYNETGRVRFTVAHELGHYFIDKHRNNLSEGKSLSFNGNLEESKQIEIEANHFAANLLMPKTHFVRLAKKLEPGLSAVLKLKARYNTSIESTVKQYVNLDLMPCLMVKWNHDLTYSYYSKSDSFLKIPRLHKHLSLKFSSDYIRSQVELIQTSGNDFIESATPISRWVPTIVPGSPRDIVGLEQTIKLGDFGGITLLTFK